MLRGVALVLLLWLGVIASPVNDKIQEAAYILSVNSDTAKAQQLFHQALVLPEASIREKLKAHLYLAKIAEAKNDTLKALEHYVFLKNNSQSISFAYMAANQEKFLGTRNEKIKIANEVRNWDAPMSQIKRDERFTGCDMEGELYLAQHIVYKCPDNSLHLVSKKD